ncbi:ATPase synthesis protein 25, mitochondrial [Paracoccidioides brasiliensis]|nr:ATPase synthesis protein 25, mitochondrial [Paracoccidioides brasiliensis]
MSRILLRGIQCHACRQNVIRSFVSASGVTITPPAIGSVSPSKAHPPHLSGSFPTRHVKLFSSQAKDDPSLAADAVSENSAAQEGSYPQENSEQHVPWYLQEEVQEMALHPMRQQQELPPLPENPPPILKILLEYISVDIGLDNLNLLDLRTLDPPPALGANLIMIFGTARSVKHLNVSADKFCRWLRTTYKLRPDADGLLGRNELKIKLRRKARRARLVKRAGSTLKQPDDGITTGWICVDVGIVEGGQLSKPEGVQKAGFVGFGTVIQGTRIVVQMMTEEKREEIDLESLWRQTLEKNSMDNPGLPKPQAEEPPQVVGFTHESSTVTAADFSHRVSQTPPIRANYEQLRSISTSLHRLRDKRGSATDFVPTDTTVATKSAKSTSSQESLPSLFNYLSNLEPDKAIDELGQGMDDRTSTSFLQRFYEELARTAPQIASVQKLELMCTAILLQHSGYRKEDLFQAFKEHIVSNYPLPRALVLRLLDALLAFKPDPNSNPPRLRLPGADMELALRLIENAALRGTNILHADFLIRVFLAVSYRTRVYAVKPENLHSAAITGNRIPVSIDEFESVQRIQTRLASIIRAAKVALGEKEYLDILRVHSDQGEYAKFWNAWGEVALAGIHRGKSFYLFLFNLHAELGDWQQSRTTLLNCIPMMWREDPPVFFDAELAEVVSKCIALAYPDIDDTVQHNLPALIVKTWHHCRTAIQNQKMNERKERLIQTELGTLPEN